MSIERQNILDLIGKNRNKYASCLITCYTFDFTFFEQRVMSILRTSNIKNVNVFLDGNYLEHYLENTDGNEFKTHKTYSLNPIYTPGVFHPKIMLLTGPMHGLLIIGSGNITSSGLSTNDEIWGAFHLNSEDSKNAPIFASVWKYLQQYVQKANGFNLHKISWITKYAPWLPDIESMATDNFIPIGKGTELKLIGNTDKVNHFQELMNSLPAKKVKKLTIVSPYFDEKGKMLEELHNTLNIDKTVCVSDSEFGLLPVKLNEKLYNAIPFYDWKNCLKNDEESYNRVHAKIFHFEYGDGWEYLLLGSANATINAFGAKTRPAKNAEAGLLLRRKSKSNFMSDLGISLSKANTIDIRSFKRNKNNVGDNQFRSLVLTKIVYAELNTNKLVVFLLKEINSKCDLIALNPEGIELEKHIINKPGTEFNVVLKQSDDAYKIYLASGGKRISNFSLIHNIAYQSKCNPDPVNAELGHIIDTFTNDPEQDKFIELLKYVDYNWADDDFDAGIENSGRIPVYKDRNKDANKTYSKITEKEFNELSSIQSRAVEHLSNPSIQIADLLNAISRGLINSDRSIMENPEEIMAGMIEEEQVGDGEEVSQSLNFRNRGAQEKRAIERHIYKVRGFFKGQLQDLFHNKSLIDVPGRPLQLKELSNLSVALDLISIFDGIKFPYNYTEFTINYNEFSLLKNLKNFLSDENYENAKKFIQSHSISLSNIKTKHDIISSIQQQPRKVLIDYIKSFEKRYKLNRLDSKKSARNLVTYEIRSNIFEDFKKEFNHIDNTLLNHQEEFSINTYYEEFIEEGKYDSYNGFGLKDYLIEMLGSFLICANSSAGFKVYEYDLLNDKSVALRKTIFELGTFFCLNIHWTESETKTKNLLLLDMLHFVFPGTINEHDIGKIKKLLNDNFKKSKYQSPSFMSNKKKYLNGLLPSYIKWNKPFASDNKSRLIKSKSNSLLNKIVFSSKIGFAYLIAWSEDALILEKPGFDWDDKANANVLKLKYPQQKIIVF